MKTPIQELIEALKIHRDTAYEKAGNSRKFTFIEYFDGRAKAFEDAISFAEAHLEKEKEVICNAYECGEFNKVIHIEWQLAADLLIKDAEDYYNETFNTEKK